MVKCPLFSIQHDTGVACLEPGCAWWDHDSKKCYVALLPNIGSIPAEMGVELRGVIASIEDLGAYLGRRLSK